MAEKSESILRRMWAAWTRVGYFIAKVNLLVMLFILYWTVFGVTALIIKLFRRDFLLVRWKGGSSYWHPVEESPRDMEAYTRQF